MASQYFLLFFFPFFLSLVSRERWCGRCLSLPCEYRKHRIKSVSFLGGSFISFRRLSDPLNCPRQRVPNSLTLRSSVSWHVWEESVALQFFQQRCIRPSSILCSVTEGMNLMEGMNLGKATRKGEEGKPLWKKETERWPALCPLRPYATLENTWKWRWGGQVLWWRQENKRIRTMQNLVLDKEAT